MASHIERNRRQRSCSENCDNEPRMLLIVGINYHQPGLCNKQLQQMQHMQHIVITVIRTVNLTFVRNVRQARQRLRTCSGIGE